MKKKKKYCSGLIGLSSDKLNLLPSFASHAYKVNVINAHKRLNDFTLISAE